MYTYLKFGLPRVFPPNMGRSHRAGPGPGSGPGYGPGYKGHNNNGYQNNGYRDSSGAGLSSGYDSSDNETTARGRISNQKMRKFRSEQDFRAIGMGGHSRAASQLHNGNLPQSALRQAHSRASIAGLHLHQQMNGGGDGRSGKHYGYRSHSEADLLGGGGTSAHDTIGRDYQRHLRHYTSDAPTSQLAPSRRQSTAMALIYPNIQVHCLDIDPSLRGVSFQAKAGDLFAIMATSSREGTLLLETLAGMRRGISGEILINGQRISRHGLKNLCSYVPAPDKCALDPRMSVKSILNFYSTLRGPSETINSKQQVRFQPEVFIHSET